MTRGTTLLLGVLSVAVILRLLCLGKESLWLDEVTSVQRARLDWPSLASVLFEQDPNMGLYYILLHLWKDVGDSEQAVRSLSVIAAVATIPVLYLLATRMFGRRVGLTSAVLLAVNAFHVRYAQEARAYSQLVFLVSLSSLLFVGSILAPSRPRWVSYVATSACAIYSHVFAVLVLAAHWTSLLFLRARRAPAEALLVSHVATAVLVLPLVVAAFRVGGRTVDWVPPPDLGSAVRLFSALTGAGGFEFPSDVGELASVPGAVRLLILAGYFTACGAATLAMLRAWSSAQRWCYIFLFTWLFVPIVLAYVVSVFKPVVISYYLLVSLPPLTVLAATGLCAIRDPRRFTVALAVFVTLAALGVASYYLHFQKEDWREATRHILTRARANDAIVFYRVRSPFDWYRERLDAAAGRPAIEVVSAWNPLPCHYTRMWLVLSHDQTLVRDPSGHRQRDRQGESIQDALARCFAVMRETRFPGVRILLYSRTQ